MDAAALREDAQTLGRDLRRAIPETYRAYGQLHSAALAPGALSTSTKELIALAIAVTRECDGCIAAHAEGAVRGGATADEVAEAIGVAILMNGGPATVYGPRAYQAFQQFTAARTPGASSTHTDHAHHGDRVSRTPGTAPPHTGDASAAAGDALPSGDDRLLLRDLDVANNCGPSHRR